MNTCLCMILISIENVESYYVTKDVGNVLFALVTRRILPINFIAIYTSTKSSVDSVTGLTP